MLSLLYAGECCRLILIRVRVYKRGDDFIIARSNHVRDAVYIKIISIYTYCCARNEFLLMSQLHIVVKFKLKFEHRRIYSLGFLYAPAPQNCNSFFPPAGTVRFSVNAALFPGPWRMILMDFNVIFTNEIGYYFQYLTRARHLNISFRARVSSRRYVKY